MAVTDSLTQHGHLEPKGPRDWPLTRSGELFCQRVGVDLGGAKRADTRHFARQCLDWSERRPHISGALGAAIADTFFKKGWAERLRRGRTVRLTDSGAGPLAATSALRSSFAARKEPFARGIFKIPEARGLFLAHRQIDVGEERDRVARTTSHRPSTQSPTLAGATKSQVILMVGTNLRRPTRCADHRAHEVGHRHHHAAMQATRGIAHVLVDAKAHDESSRVPFSPFLT